MSVEGQKQETLSSAVEAEGVSFAYDREDVLDGLSLTIGAGSFTGLLGPNGSGKTTLIQLLAGAFHPRAGQVRVLGRELSSWDRRELARTVAVVPQRFDLAFPFTVEEVVLLGRVPHRGPLSLDSPDDLRVAREAMESTGVRDLAGRRITELSGGEQKRVVVAKALAQQPKILLLDEPAAHLDIRHQIGLYRLIDSIRRQTGLTVLSAMHDLNLAAAFCDRVALLKAGRLVASGPIPEVMTYRRLSEVFETDIYVGVNDLTGHRLFSPMIGGSREAP
jgi:iron complex transport system ATP-binding protein